MTRLLVLLAALALLAAVGAGANLTDTRLTKANLTNANLTNAELTHADLTGADLFYANLTDARLTANNLTQEQLDSACIIEGGKPPSLPEGLKPPQKVCVL